MDDAKGTIVQAWIGFGGRSPVLGGTDADRHTVKLQEAQRRLICGVGISTGFLVCSCPTAAGAAAGAVAVVAVVVVAAVVAVVVVGASVWGLWWAESVSLPLLLNKQGGAFVRLLP